MKSGDTEEVTRVQKGALRIEVCEPGELGELNFYFLLEGISSDFLPRLNSQVSSIRAWSKKLSRNAVAITATDECGQIRGLCCFYSNSQGAFIPIIWTSLSVRGQGLAQDLLEVCAKNLIQLGVKFIELESHNQNIIATRFYIRHGFSIQSQNQRRILWRIRTSQLARVRKG